MLHHRLQSNDTFSNGGGLNCQFISGQISRDNEGVVWVGTSNGLLWANPKDVEMWRKGTSFRIVVYDVKVNGLSVDFARESALNNRHGIRLTWNMDAQVLGLKPILEDFARPQGRIYEWQLDDGAWQGMRDGDELLLENLALGRHRLTIRLAGAPGTAQNFAISVIPSAWAWIELFLLLAVIVGCLWGRRKYRHRTSALQCELEQMEDALLEQEQKDVADDEKPKYSRVKVSEEEAHLVMERLKQRMETERLYANADLKLSELAKMMDISASKLSIILSQHEGGGYYEFVNAYRLAEFKRLIAAGAHEHYTITALSEQCGFKKTSFFLTFRRVEGMTPNEYLKHIGIVTNRP